MRKITFLLLLNCVFIMAQTKTVVTMFGEKVPLNLYANNGLSTNNGYFQLGGELIQPSVISTTSANTFSLLGLQHGSNLTDNIVFTDNSGVLKTLPIPPVNVKFWRIAGNPGTDADINFLGTIDNIPLQFRINNTNSGQLLSTSTSFGYNSLNLGSTGLGNTAMGAYTLYSNTIGNQNIAISDSALKNITTGYSNIAIGDGSLKSNVTGMMNIAIGTDALSVATGNSNVAIGNQSGKVLTSGSSNIIIGASVANRTTSGNYNMAIGITSNPPPVVNYGLNIANAIFGININSSPDPNLRIGIAGSNPTNTLHVFYSDFIRNAVRIEGLKRADTNGLTITDTDKVIIAEDTGVLKIVLTPTIITSGTPSDLRLKKDIENSTYGLNFITKLRPVTYKLKTGTDQLQTGFIAQEVEAAAKSLNYDFNGVVKPKTADGFYSLRYDQFVAPLVKAIQEQQTELARIPNIEKDQEEQQKQINELRNLVTELIKK